MLSKVSRNSVQIVDAKPEHAKPLYEAFSANPDTIKRFTPLMEDIHSSEQLHKILGQDLPHLLSIKTTNVMEVGRPVGTISAMTISSPEKHTVSILNSWIGHEYQGRDVMLNARALFHRKAFTNSQKTAIESSIMGPNKANQRLVEKLGAVQTDAIHYDISRKKCDEEVSVQTSYVYELSAERWKNLQNEQSKIGVTGNAFLA